jgi:magnesium chelatase accessory protein
VPHDLPADWPHRAHSRVVTCGRLRWHVQRAGTGPTVVLIHGTAGATHTWRGVFAELIRTCECVAIDLPGHGFTHGADDDDMSLEAMSRAVDEVFTALDVSPKIGVGHSAGVAVLLHHAVTTTRPSPAAIVGVNSALVPPLQFMQNVLQPVTQSLFSISPVTSLAAHALAAGLAKALLRSTQSTLEPAQEARYIQLLSDPARVRTAMQTMARWQLPALHALLPEVACSVHLLHSRTEPWVPWHALETATRALRDRRVTDVPGAGHLIPETHPQVVADAVRAALLTTR